MSKAGVLENPKADAALMIHVMAADTLIVSAPGVSAPAADYFEIRIQGRGCHGPMSNTGVASLMVAAHILISLQEIHAGELALDDCAVLTIGKMNAGTAANVIPDTVIMSGSIRTFDEETRAFIKRRMIEIAEEVAQTFRAAASVVFGSGCPTLVNDRELSVCFEKYVRELLGKE